jgi:hypothetical protein
MKGIFCAVRADIPTFGKTGFITSIFSVIDQWIIDEFIV